MVGLTFCRVVAAGGLDMFQINKVLAFKFVSPNENKLSEIMNFIFKIHILIPLSSSVVCD